MCHPSSIHVLGWQIKTVLQFSGGCLSTPGVNLATKHCCPDYVHNAVPGHKRREGPRRQRADHSAQAHRPVLKVRFGGRSVRREGWKLRHDAGCLCGPSVKRRVLRAWINMRQAERVVLRMQEELKLDSAGVPYTKLVLCA